MKYSGAAAARTFHHAANPPCGSVSNTAVRRAVCLAASTARCPQRVVFPTPPFWLARTTVRKEAPWQGNHRGIVAKETVAAKRARCESGGPVATVQRGRSVQHSKRTPC